MNDLEKNIYINYFIIFYFIRLDLGGKATITTCSLVSDRNQKPNKINPTFSLSSKNSISIFLFFILNSRICSEITKNVVTRFILLSIKFTTLAYICNILCGILCILSDRSCQGKTISNSRFLFIFFFLQVC